MSKPLILIGLTGLRQSGKDTTGALLKTHCRFTPIAFADPLRAEIADAFNISIDPLLDNAVKELPLSALALHRCTDSNFEAAIIAMHHRAGEGRLLDMTAPRSPRQILQWWGTEYRRARDPRYWTRKALERISYLHNRQLSSRIVITDVRFPNEVALVRELGGWIWQIKRPGQELPPGSHTSETTGAAFQPDAVINNSHDMRHLQQLVLSEVMSRETGLKLRVEVAA